MKNVDQLEKIMFRDYMDEKTSLGLSRYEYYVAAAMQGMLASPKFFGNPPNRLALLADEYAYEALKLNFQHK